MEFPSTKFENWRPELKEAFANRFAEAFNEAKQTGFHANALAEDQDYDFLLTDATDKRSLRVQHTSAGTDAELERIRPKNSTVVIQAARKHLQGLGGYFVSLNIPNPPEKKDEADRLGYEIAHLVRTIAAKNPRPALFRYRAAEMDYLLPIQERVSDLEVFSAPHLQEVVFGWGWSRPLDGAVLGDDQRVDMAVGAKEKRYAHPQDVVLIVQCDMLPITDVYVNLIREQQSKRGFLSIWLYDAFGDVFIEVK